MPVNGLCARVMWRHMHTSKIRFSAFFSNQRFFHKVLLNIILLLKVVLIDKLILGYYETVVLRNCQGNVFRHQILIVQATYVDHVCKSWYINYKKGKEEISLIFMRNFSKEFLRKIPVKKSGKF